MSEGTMNDTDPPEDRAENCRRLVTALCDEYGAGQVADVAIGLIPGPQPATAEARP